jgi:2-methylisocitrate lyase-like PEP mutase family enzyme
VGVVGANIEDQRLPLADAVERMAAAVRAGAAEGVQLVLNARTDVLLGVEVATDELVADAIARGQAFLDVGADCVFVPGVLSAEVITRLVAGLGVGKLSVLGFPGMPGPAALAELGVTRVSYGPAPYRAALAALAEFGTARLSG